LLGTSKSPRESIKKAVELTQKSLAVDDSRAESHALLGYFYSLRKEWDKAIAEGERGVALNPSGADVKYWYAATLTFAGKPEEAILLFEKAIRLNPFGPSRYFLSYGHALRYAGRFEEAVSAYKKAIQREPNNFFAHLNLAATYNMMGLEKEAQAEASEVLRLNPKFSLDYLAKVSGYKDRTEIEKIITALRKAGLPENPPLALPDKPSIAVLPFVNMSGDSDQEYFSDGISEEIITALSKTPKLFVIARTSSFKYKGKEVDVRTVGRELGVRYVLEGSVRKAGDKVRITAQLIDAKTNKHLWAERYDRDLKDIFAIQDDITKNIITEVQVLLTAGEQARLRAKGTDNLDAYLKYLQGWEASRHWNKEASIKARKLAEETIAIAPDYQRGYYLLATVEIHDIFLGLSKAPKDTLMRAIEMAKKSIAIEDSSFPHHVLAVSYNLLRKHETAIAEARKAVEIGPNYADAYMILGHVLWLSDMAEKAVPVLQKAIRLNPYPPSQYYHNLAFAYHQLEKYEEAIAEAKKALGVSPKDIIAYRALVSCYSILGREEEARAAAAEVLKIDPDFSIDRYAKTIPYKNKEKLKKIVESYRRAGLK
jgi:TolB-like protein/Tfp pilus assembly protein PilF